MAKNGLHARLRTYGPWGTAAPGLTLNFNSNAGWEQAASERRIRGIELLDGSNARYGRNSTRRKRKRDDEPMPIILSSYEVFPASWNQKSAWSAVAGSMDDLMELPAPFRSGVEEATPGIGFKSGTPNTPNQYQSGIPMVAANSGFLVRFYQYKPGQAQKRPQLCYMWDRFMLKISDGRPEFLLLSPQWTQTQESQLYALQKVKDPSTGQTNTIEDLQHSLYLVRENINVGGGSDSWFNAVQTLEVLRGGDDAVYVMCGGKSTRIEIPKEYGASWGASALTVRGEGGMYFWQVGYRSHLPLGSLALTHYISVPELAFGDAVISIAGEKPAGTNITVDNEPVGDGDDRKYITKLNLTSSNSRYTPIFSALAIDLAGGIRSGGRFGDETMFDSDDTDDPTGHPVKDVTVSFEAEMRRAQYIVDHRDINGKTLNGVGWHYTALENEVSRLEVGGVPVITNGIVKEAVAYNMRGVTENQPRIQVANANSGIRSTVVDAWYILDEMPMRREFVGDWKRLGLYIRTILKGAGFSDAELAGINPNSGRILPGATAGQDWLMKPNKNIMFGDYLRDLIHKWGMGWQLYIDGNGVWQFRAPVKTPVAIFSRNRNQPGAHVTYKALDLPREVTEFFNDFIVQGEAPDGTPIVESFQIARSVSRVGGGPPDKNYIGRKRTKIYEDRAITNRNDALWVVRSLREYFGMPPRFAHFESDWISNIFPGQFVEHDGILCKLQSITGGQAKRNRMAYLLREAA